MLDSVEDLRQFVKNTRTGETPGATLEELGTFLEEAAIERVKKCTEILEEELTCTVCRGMVIEAVVTDCHHVFCNFCLNRWLVEKHTCPICRSAVRRTGSIAPSEDIRNTTIEAIVDTIMDKLMGEEYKQHKQVEIEDRVNSEKQETLLKIDELMKRAHVLRSNRCYLHMEENQEEMRLVMAELTKLRRQLNT